MDSNSDGEEMDIALFNKKFQKSEKNTNKNNKRSERYVESVNDMESKVKTKAENRKHKQSPESDGETDVVPSKKKTVSSSSSHSDDDFLRETSQSGKRRKKQLKDSNNKKAFVGVMKANKQSDKLHSSVGTSSEESELEPVQKHSKMNKAKEQKEEAEAKKKRKETNAEMDSIWVGRTTSMLHSSVISSHSDSSDSTGGSSTDEDFEAEVVKGRPDRTTGNLWPENINKIKAKHKSDVTMKFNEKSESDSIKTNAQQFGKTPSSSNEFSSDSENSDSSNYIIPKTKTEFMTKISDKMSGREKDSNKKTLAYHTMKKDIDSGKKEKSSKLLENIEDRTNAASDEIEVEDEYDAIKKELADIPLEDLIKIKDKLGLKAFSKIMHGGKVDSAEKKRVFKRANKNRPMEMSSKKRVPILRQTDVPKKKVTRDPRFDDLSGEYQEEIFEKNYSFLQDLKTREREVVKKKMKKLKNAEKKQKLQYLLTRMNQQQQAAKQKQRQKEIERSLKQKEKELIKEGKTPYFLKKTERRQLELAEKYKQLQKSGKVEQYLGRKRRKNAQKEKKKLPGKHTRF